MAHFDYEGQRVELAEDWRVGELIRAENELDLDMDTAKTGGKTALVLYISMARVDGWKPGEPGNRRLADIVMRMELTELGDTMEDDDAGPPAGEPAAELNGGQEASENGEPPIGGRLLSEVSE